MKLIMVVEGAFWLKGRGLVVTGQLKDGVTASVGDAVLVAKPNNLTTYDAVITGIEMINKAFVNLPSKTVAFGLKDDLGYMTKNEVKEGDLIYKIEGMVIPGEPPEDFKGINWGGETYEPCPMPETVGASF